MYTPFNTDPTVNSSRHSLLPVKESNDNVFTSLNWAMFSGSGKNNHYIYRDVQHTAETETLLTVLFKTLLQTAPNVPHHNVTHKIER